MSCSSEQCPYFVQREVAQELAKECTDKIRAFASSAPNVITATEAAAQPAVSDAYDRLKEKFPDLCPGAIEAPNREKPGIFCPVEQMARQSILTAGATVHQRDISNTGQYL